MIQKETIELGERMKTKESRLKCYDVGLDPLSSQAQTDPRIHVELH